jgi:hypothetical protein
MADVPSGLSLTHPKNLKKIKFILNTETTELHGNSRVGYLVREISCLHTVVEFLIYIFVKFHLADHSDHAV